MFRRRLCYLLISYLFCQVDCEPTGATEESCGDIFPMHYSDNNETMFQDSFVCDLDNLASLGFTKCFELIVEGFENMSNFTYNCGQSYNVTLTGDEGTLRGYMIVARNKSEEYIVDSALVGKWSIPAELQDDAHIICAGKAVTQSRVNTELSSTTFTWEAPGPGDEMHAQFWFTVVSAPTAFFAQVRGISATPNETSCRCQMNHYIAMRGGQPECIPCPSNSSAPAGLLPSCTCEMGTGRCPGNNISQPCLSCPGPVQVEITDNTGVNIEVTWTSPEDCWKRNHTVTIMNGTTLLYRASVGSNTSLNVSLPTVLTTYNVCILTTLEEDNGCESTSACVDVTAQPECTISSRESLTFIEDAIQMRPGEIALVWSSVCLGSTVQLVQYLLTCQCQADYTMTSFMTTSVTYVVSNLPGEKQCSCTVAVATSSCPLTAEDSPRATYNFTTVAVVLLPPKITPTVEPDSNGNIQVKASSDRYGIECRFETADLSFTIFSPNTSDIVLPIKAGSYVVKCAALNSTGVRGPFSAPKTVIVQSTDVVPSNSSSCIPQSTFIGVLIALGVLLIVLLVITLVVTLVFTIRFCRNRSGGHTDKYEVTILANEAYGALQKPSAPNKTENEKDSSVILKESTSKSYAHNAFQRASTYDDSTKLQTDEF